MITSFMHKLEKLINRIFNGFDNFYNRIQGSRKLKIGGFIALALFFGLAIYVMNVMTPMVIDDFSYSMNSHGEHVRGFKDILERQYDHYFDWGGRTVVHVIAQLLLFIPPQVADVVNSLAFVFCIYLMYLHALGRRGKSDLILFAVMAVLMWLLQPAFGESILWLTGSANYVFGMILVLLFLLPYRRYSGRADDKYFKIKTLFALPFGLLAGWTNENTAAAMILMAVLFLVYYKQNEWNVPLWSILGIVGALVGYAIMILAPGNYARSVIIGLEFELTAVNLFSGFFLGTRSFVEYLGILNLFGLIFLVLNKYSEKERIKWSENSFAYIVYMLGALCAIYVMMFSPLFPPRAWFGIVVFNIIAVGTVFNSMDYTEKTYRAIKYIVAFVVIALLFPFTYHYGYKDISTVDKALRERFYTIENTPDDGEALQFDFIECQTRFGTSDNPFVESTYSMYYKRKIEIRKSFNDLSIGMK